MQLQKTALHQPGKHQRRHWPSGPMAEYECGKNRVNKTQQNDPLQGQGRRVGEEQWRSELSSRQDSG